MSTRAASPTKTTRARLLSVHRRLSSPASGVLAGPRSTSCTSLLLTATGAPVIGSSGCMIIPSQNLASTGELGGETRTGECIPRLARIRVLVSERSGSLVVSGCSTTSSGRGECGRNSPCAERSASILAVDLYRHDRRATAGRVRWCRSLERSLQCQQCILSTDGASRRNALLPIQCTHLPGSPSFDDRTMSIPASLGVPGCRCSGYGSTRDRVPRPQRLRKPKRRRTAALAQRKSGLRVALHQVAVPWGVRPDTGCCKQVRVEIRRCTQVRTRPKQCNI
ncbi:hypothetical protein FKP32DRAFT_1228109 [Trametes sanguinea]|nr:hypothetical protein FKP32DRAFT_1228109 [Trametes sanguinea]